MSKKLEIVFTGIQLAHYLAENCEGVVQPPEGANPKIVRVSFDKVGPQSLIARLGSEIEAAVKGLGYEFKPPTVLMGQPVEFCSFFLTHSQGHILSIEVTLADGLARVTVNQIRIAPAAS